MPLRAGVPPVATFKLPTLAAVATPDDKADCGTGHYGSSTDAPVVARLSRSR